MAHDEHPAPDGAGAAMATAAAAAAPVGHGAGEKHAHPNYMAVFWALLALTIVEVFTPILLPTGGFKIFLLSGMAAAKAGLVAFYFMHLKFELPNLKVMVATPLVFATVLAFALLWEATALYDKMQNALKALGG
jgi:cytochrome c oxidase subunit 4